MQLTSSDGVMTPMRGRQTDAHMSRPSQDDRTEDLICKGELARESCIESMIHYSVSYVRKDLIVTMMCGVK